MIVSAGLAVNGGAGDRAMDDVQFLRGMYAAGAKPYFDVLGSHPYGFGYAPEDNYDGWSGWWWQRVSAQTQADYLVRAFRFASANWPWMGILFVWNMDYDLVPWNEYCDPKGWFAILNQDGTSRPAYSALQRLAREPDTPPAPATPVSTHTPTPRPTTTYPMLPTPAEAEGTGSVYGRVLLQGRSFHGGISVMIGEHSTSTDADGGFALAAVPAGAQELCAQMPAYLRLASYGVKVRPEEITTLPDVMLCAGDINADDRISLFDLVAVSSRYGARGSGYAEDLNGNGEIDLFDLVLVSTNYGASAIGQ
jgi:hypothetical protein